MAKRVSITIQTDDKKTDIRIDMFCPIDNHRNTKDIHNLLSNYLDPARISMLIQEYAISATNYSPDYERQVLKCAQCRNGDILITMVEKIATTG